MGKLFNQTFTVEVRTDKPDFESWFREKEAEIRADERTKTIDEVIDLARAEIDFVSQAEQKRFVEFMKALKEQKNAE